MYLNILTVMYRSHNRYFTRKTFWVFFLTLALVFVQGVRLHAHVYDHDPVTSDHSHQEQAHFHYETSGTGHSDEVAEVDLSQQGFLKSLLKALSLGLLTIAFFSAVIVFPSSRLLSKVPWPPDRQGSLASRLFRMRPPLRAPPL